MYLLASLALVASRVGTSCRALYRTVALLHARGIAAECCGSALGFVQASCTNLGMLPLQRQPSFHESCLVSSSTHQRGEFLPCFFNSASASAVSLIGVFGSGQLYLVKGRCSRFVDESNESSISLKMLSLVKFFARFLTLIL